jgi:hypothetical protein
VAFGTRVYLTSIEEVHGLETKATPFWDAMPLSWPLNDYEPRDIPPGPNFYVDLVKISKHGAGWLFGVNQLYSSQSGMTDFRGRYRFHLVATSQNGVSPQLAVDVIYEQDWHTLRTLSATTK